MGRESLEARERIGLVKKRHRRVEMKVLNEIIVERRTPSGEWVEEARASNSVLGGGIDLFLDLLTGASSAFYDGGSYLRLTDGAGGTITTFGPADSGPQNATATNTPGHRREWIFEDVSSSSYSWNNAQFFNDDPGAGGTQFNDFAFGSQQSKGTNEPIRFRVQVEIYSTNTNFTDAGMQRAVQRLSGELGAPFDGNNVTVQPEDGGGSPVGSEVAADGAPTVDKGADEVQWAFTSPNGSNEGEWATTRIIHDSSGSTIDVRDGPCADDGTSCGTKGTGEEWTYKWTFGFS